MNWSLYLQLVGLFFILYLIVHALIEQYFKQVRETEVEVGKELREHEWRGRP